MDLPLRAYNRFMPKFNPGDRVMVPRRGEIGEVVSQGSDLLDRHGTTERYNVRFPGSGAHLYRADDLKPVQGPRVQPKARAGPNPSHRNSGP